MLLNIHFQKYRYNFQNYTCTLMKRGTGAEIKLKR